MPGAYCYAELGCMIQKSGADYAYIHFAFGPFLAFIRMWIECIILRPCIGAIQSLTFALYILKPFFPECEPPSDSVRILAAACLCLLCFINCFSVKWAAMVRQADITAVCPHVSGVLRSRTTSPTPSCSPSSSSPSLASSSWATARRSSSHSRTPRLTCPSLLSPSTPGCSPTPAGTISTSLSRR